MNDTGAKQRLARWLAQRFFVRFHLSLILGAAFGAGLLATKGFLALGLDTMHWRWPIALAFAYLTFLLCVRIWLGYIGLGRYLDSRTDFDIPDLGFSGNSGGDSSAGGVSFGNMGVDIHGITPGGGEFAGGGASGNYGLPIMDSGSGQASSLSLPDVDLGDSDEGFLILLIILLLLLAIFGAGAYMIWQAPTLLAEAAFQAALAAGMVKPARRIRDPGWVGGAVRASWLPFLFIFLCAMLIAGLAEHYSPQARTLPEAIRILLQ